MSFLIFFTTTLFVLLQLSSHCFSQKQPYLLPYCSKLSVDPFNSKITVSTTTLTFSATGDLWFYNSASYSALNPNNTLINGKYFHEYARSCVYLMDTVSPYTAYLPSVSGMNLTSTRTFTATFTGLPTNKRLSLTMPSCFFVLFRESEYHQEFVPLPPISVNNYATGSTTVASYAPSYDYDTYFGKHCLNKVSNATRFSLATFSTTTKNNVQSSPTTTNYATISSDSYVKTYSNSKLTISGNWKYDSFNSQITSFTHSNYNYQLYNPINLLLQKNTTYIKYPLQWKRHINVASEAVSFSIPSDVTKRCADPSELQYLLDYYISNSLNFKVNDIEGETPWFYGTNPSSPAEETNVDIILTFPYYEAIFYSGVSPYLRALVRDGILTVARTDVSTTYFSCAKNTLRNQYQYWVSTVYHHVRFGTIHNMYKFNSAGKSYNLNALAEIIVGNQKVQLTDFVNQNSKSDSSGLSIQISDTSLNDSFYSQTKLIPIYQYNETVNSIYDFTFIYDSELGSKTSGALITQEDFVTAYKTTACAGVFGSQIDNQLSNFFMSNNYTFVRLPEFSNRLNYSKSVSYNSLSNSIEMFYLNHEQSIQFSLTVDSSLLVYKEAQILMEDFSLEIVPNRQEWNEMNATLIVNVTNSGNIDGNYVVTVACQSPPITFKEQNSKTVTIKDGETISLHFEVTNMEWKSYTDIQNISCQFNVTILKEELWTDVNKEISVEEVITLDHGYFVPYCEQKYNEPFIEFIENQLNQSIFTRDSSDTFYNSILFTVKSNTTDQISARYNISVVSMGNNPFSIMNSSILEFELIPQEELIITLPIFSLEFEKIMRERIDFQNYSFQITIQNMNQGDCWSSYGKSIAEQLFTFHVRYECPENYVGVLCDIPVCYGVNASDTDFVCSGHGSCVYPDSCQCSNGYTSENCSIPICYDFNSTDSRVCSTHGQCLAPDVCLCTEEYTGPLCSIPICYGIAATNETVCFGHGNCSNPNICNCQAGYTENNCSVPICFEVNATDSSVCSSHGQCRAPDECYCGHGYTSSNCSIPICFDLHLNMNESSLICSSHGHCVEPDICQCETGYYGPECQLHNCFNIQFNDSSTVCYGHGNCTSPNTCRCIEGFTSDDCSIPICFGYNASDITNVCSSHGECVQPNSCHCHTGYTSSNCSIPICFGVHSETNDSSPCSSNGECVHPDVCSCFENFYGYNCELFDCFGVQYNDSNGVCSGFGNCNSPNTCQCNEGYLGENCSYFECFDFLMNNSNRVCSTHGKCLSPNNCSCDNGYFGQDCSQYTCFEYLFNDTSNVCSGHGSCLQPDNCSCELNYFGSKCEETFCFGIESNSSATCSGFGNCTLFNWCECDSKHVGENCSITSCSGVLSNNSNNVCSGKGKCIDYNHCNCSEGYYGKSCELFDCFGLEKNHSKVCSGKGNCNDSNTCHCKVGYYGENCEDFNCFGFHKDDIQVCSQVAPCTSPNNCSCQFGFYGAKCELFDCFDIPSNDSQVCSGHGQCHFPNNCSCSPNYYGDECKLYDCFNVPYNSSQVCHGRGQCTSHNICKCQEGFLGNECHHYTCFGLHWNDSNVVCSGNGSCNSLNNCTCFDGFEGVDCSLKIPNPIISVNQSTNSSTNSTNQSTESCPQVNGMVCSHHGFCNNSQCTCNYGYSGVACQFIECFGINSSDTSSVCSGKGQCTDPDQCHCNDGYSSSNCSSLSCFNKQSTDPSACSGHGYCHEPDTCLCHTGFYGSQCDLIKCFSILSNQSNVCNGRGTCIMEDNCSCITGYLGEQCNIPLCFNVSIMDKQENDSQHNVCNGNGECIEKDTCQCHSGYLGEECQFTKCNQSSCIHGNCANAMDCECVDGYGGEYCEEEVCFGYLASDSNVCSGRGRCTSPDYCNCSSVAHGGTQCEFEQDTDEQCSLYGQLTVFSTNWMSESLTAELREQVSTGQILRSNIKFSSNLFLMNRFTYPIKIQNNGIRKFHYSIRSYCENGQSFKSLGKMVQPMESSNALSQGESIQIENDESFGFAYYSSNERFENIECKIELIITPADRMDNCLNYDSLHARSFYYNTTIIFEKVDSCHFIKETTEETTLNTDHSIQASLTTQLTNQSIELYTLNTTESYLKILSIFPQKRNNWKIQPSSSPNDNTTTALTSASLLITAQLQNPQNLYGIFTPSLYCKDQSITSGELLSENSLVLYHEMPTLVFQFNVTIQNISQELIDYGRVRGGKEGTASVNIESMNLNCSILLIPTSHAKCWSLNQNSKNNNKRSYSHQNSTQLQLYLESLKQLICHFTLPIVSGEFKFIQSVRSFEIGVVALTYTCMTLGFASMICTTKGPRDRKHSLLQLVDFVKETRRKRLQDGDDQEHDELNNSNEDRLPFCENCGHKTLKRAKYEIIFDSHQQQQSSDRGFHVCEKQPCFEAMCSLYNDNYYEYFTCYDCRSGQLVEFPPFSLHSVDHTDLPESQTLMDTFNNIDDDCDVDSGDELLIEEEDEGKKLYTV